MKNSLIEQMYKVVSFPVYFFKKTDLGYECRKIVMNSKKPEFKIYLITGDFQCSCFSWMKVGGLCKHLKMLRGVPLTDRGISGESVKNKCLQIITAVGSIHNLNVEDAPYVDNTNLVQITSKAVPPKNLDRICWSITEDPGACLFIVKFNPKPVE